jgi:signal transduction histidine kinase
MSGPRLSFRTRILLVVLVVALLPLALLGFWLVGSTGRAGEALLLSRLEQGRIDATEVVTTRWVSQRPTLLSVAEAPEIAALLDGEGEGTGWPAGVPRPGATVAAMELEDSVGVIVWRASLAGGQPSKPMDPVREGEPTFAVRLPLWRGPADEPSGTLIAHLTADALLPPTELPPSTAGMVIALIDIESGTPLRPVAVDPELLASPEFRWAGDRWLVSGQTFEDPPVRVVLAAPVTPFTAPFREAASRSAMLVVGVLALGLLLAWGLAVRLTGSLEELSEAAKSVAGGDLKRRVGVRGSDEVAQVAEAFNAMTLNLEQTLDQLSKRESLAAVGEFAASLAHEVRNPLTAIRLDLQRVQAGLPEDSPLKTTQARALMEIERLNDTVQQTLVSARAGGSQEGSAVDLRSPLSAAADAARPSFEERGAHLDLVTGEEPAVIRGDAAALEQLFLNLLLNAARALASGGRAEASIQRLQGRGFAILVEDGGVGIPEDLQDRIFEPLFTTNPEGTGLGLTVARRITEAHGGTIALDSAPGRGTRVTVTLPVDRAGDTAHGTSEASRTL